MKHILTTAALIIYTLAGAQTIPNAGMENWATTGGYQEPNGWGTPNLFTNQPSVTRATSAHQGTYSAKIETAIGDVNFDGTDDTIAGVLFLGSANPFTPSIGMPFTSRPDSLIGWYKYTPGTGDVGGGADITLTKWNTATQQSVTIANGQLMLTSAANFTRFAVELDYTSTDAPDTLVVFFVSSLSQQPVLGSTLWIDDLSLVTNSTAGIPTKTENSMIQLYPNPARESVNLVVPKDATVEIYNALGMRVETVRASASKTTTLSTARYDNGVYLVKTDSGHMQRFVVKH